MSEFLLGIEELVKDKNRQKLVKGQIGVLCHSASIDRHFKHTIDHLQKIFPNRLSKIFGPQHGLVTDVQDNMVETKHFTHPYYQLPVYSLYSETRVPTDEMLEGLDTIIVDLQDVGTRVYTYISTLTYLLRQCSRLGIRVVILDRPNPVGGQIIEGDILEEKYVSFVGTQPIPQRHGLTIAEFAKFCVLNENLGTDLQIVPMANWKREMVWANTGLPWVNPSPNLATPDSALTFCGTVLFEGTNISEGRGTTRALETLGHPKLNPHQFIDSIDQKMLELPHPESFILRPTAIHPMFQKHAGKTIGAIQIHVVDPKKFYSWHVGQFLLRELYAYLGKDFKWNDKPYEYETKHLAIDFINGTDRLRHWVENSRPISELTKKSGQQWETYLKKRSTILMYS